MPFIALTTLDCSNFLSLSIKCTLQKAARESWQSQPRKGRGGGYEWLFSSMPRETQEEIRKAEARKALEEAATDKTLPETMNGNTGIAELSPAHKQAMFDDRRRHKALAKDDLLDKYIAWQRKFGATVVQKEQFIHAYRGGKWAILLSELGPKISWKSLERWKLERKTKGTCIALADTRGIAHRGQSMLTERHRMIILGQVLDGDRQLSTCIRQIQARCQAEQLIIPSEDTIRRWVKKYSETSYQEWILFRKGEKAWNDNCALSILRDWTLIEVGDVVIADGHTLNFETVNPETGKPCRMTLLLFMDGRSRYPLGWEVMATENVACISSAFRRTCMTLGKFPKVVYLDNGRAFRAKFFQGCPDFEQAGFTGIYKELGCTVIHAWPYHGQSKPIERFFGTMHELEELAPSYTGWDIAHKPARMLRNEKLHRALHEKLGRCPLTIEETHAWLAEWFSVYSQRPQKKTHLDGQTPLEIFEAGKGPGVDAEKLTMMMLQKEIRTISKDGIRMFGRLYWSEELANRRHPVLVRYDWQLSPWTVLVYDEEGKFICEARDRHHFRIAAGIHPAAGALGTEAQQQEFRTSLELTRRQAREARKGIRQLTEAIVLPEAGRPKDPRKMEPKPIQLPKSKPLTSEEKKAIEAIRDQARNELAEPSYKPSLLRRWRDEPERYEYLWKIRHEEGLELVEEDRLFMESFERTENYKRNFKKRYDFWLELLEFRKSRAATA